jgi:hypothetical protein
MPSAESHVVRPSQARDDHTCCYHVAAAHSVLADRERELLAIKGPCSTKTCRLHYAHSGPCDIASEQRS